MKKPDTPNLDKMLEVKDQSHICGELLDWLLNVKQYELCTVEEVEVFKSRITGKSLMEDELRPVNVIIEKTLAEFFGIDYEEMQAERGRIYQYMREMTNAV